jgi:hypothetical protein
MERPFFRRAKPLRIFATIFLVLGALWFLLFPDHGGTAAGLIGFVLWAFIGIRLEFRVPEPRADDLLAWDRETDADDPEAPAERVPLGEGETVRAALDTSVPVVGTDAGYVLTDRRLLALRGGEVTWSCQIEEVETVILRRIWFPSVPHFGRGEILGHGPLRILRGRFRSAAGEDHVFRWSEPAGRLLPFLRLLFDVFDDRVRLKRALPGV